MNKNSFSLALLGDTMLTRRVSVAKDDAFLNLREWLGGRDAVFANLEATVRHPDEGAPNITVGTYMTTPPELLADLKWLGVGVVSCANNHAFDYGEEGLLATIDHLDAAGIAHAGSGRNLAEARAPGYLDTAKGRVAVVATTATYKVWSRASAQRPDMQGRPGINPFSYETTYTVDEAAFEALRRVSKGLGFEKSHERDLQHFFSEKDLGGAKRQEQVSLFGQRFNKGVAFNVASAPNMADMEGNLRAIRDARRQADWVVASFHTHEFGGRSMLTAATKADLEELADFTRVYAHAAIDAGADVFVGHGPHTALGMEIYKGKPILYSIGNFIFMNETVPAFPAEAYERFGLGPDATPADFLDARTNNDTKGHPASAKFWQGIAAVCEYEGRELTEIQLHPLDLGFGQPRSQRGRPTRAEGKLAEQILERFIRLSQPYGTKIAVRDGIGVIALQ